MSTKVIENVTCPICGTKDEMEGFSQLSSADDPQAAKALIDGSLFSHTCPKCGMSSPYRYPMLYLDDEHKAAIQLTSECSAAEHDGEEGAACRAKGYAYRVVHTQNELREKARIFGDGLDDRTVEAVKGAYIGNFVANGKVSKDAKLFYAGRTDGGKMLLEVHDAGKAQVAELPAEAYKSMNDQVEEFAEENPSVVDQEWARRYLRMTRL